MAERRKRLQRLQVRTNLHHSMRGSGSSAGKQNAASVPELHHPAVLLGLHVSALRLPNKP